jgi:hypothetical protein
LHGSLHVGSREIKLGQSGTVAYSTISVDNKGAAWPRAVCNLNFVVQAIQQGWKGEMEGPAAHHGMILFL